MQSVEKQDGRITLANSSDMADHWILWMFGNRRPLAFDAGDSNLYRYAGNTPTNGTDPSGLVELPSPSYRIAPRTPRERAAEEAFQGRLRDQLQGLPLSDHFRVIVVFNPGGLDADFTLAERRGIRSIMLQAAQRIEDAYSALNDEWTENTRQFRSDVLPGGVRVQSAVWLLINTNRANFLDKLRTMVVALTCSDGRHRGIWVTDRRNETHEDRNPMYTNYTFGRASSLRLRSHYWDIGDDRRVFWMIHESGRYFLNLEDQERVGGFRAPEAVQTWDEYVGWLADRHRELVRPPRP